MLNLNRDFFLAFFHPWKWSNFGETLFSWASHDYLVFFGAAFGDGEKDEKLEAGGETACRNNKE